MAKVGDTVQAIRDGKHFKKGDIGTIDNMWSGDSELYIGVNLGGKYIGPSLFDYWTVIPKPVTSRRKSFK